MKKFILILFLLVQVLFINAQITSNIRGVVVDKVSQSPIIGAQIILVGAKPLKGTITDFNGEFFLEGVPVGRQTIEVSFIGYEKRLIPNLFVISAKDYSIYITLKENIESLQEVVITGSDKREAINKMNTVSSRTISIEEASRFSGSLQDPARMTQNYAGVNGANDERNDIIVRGNSSLGVL